jgi:hypothetical protein
MLPEIIFPCTDIIPFPISIHKRFLLLCQTNERMMKQDVIVITLVLITILLSGCAANHPLNAPITPPLTVTAQGTREATVSGSPVPSNNTTVYPTIRSQAGNENIMSNDLFFLAPMKARYYEGDIVTVQGTTILAPGDHLLVEVVSSSFGPTIKTDRQFFTGVSGVVRVREGPQGGPNTWSFSFPTDGFALDTYIVTVTGLTVKVQDSTTFELLPRM